MSDQLPAVQSDAASLMAVISKAATDPTCDVGKMERLFQLYKEMDAKRAERAFYAAMEKVQAEVPKIHRDKKNEHKNYKYSTLEEVNDGVVPVYTKHGFALSFGTADGAPSSHYRMVCHVSHRDGHARDYQADLPSDLVGDKGNANKTAIQGFGSSMSYGRRYLTLLIFNVSTTDDDDGEGGRGHQPPAPKMSEGAMKARAWMGAAVHDLHGFTESTELENWLLDMRGHCLRICRDYRPIWIAPNFSGLRDVIMQAAQRLGIQPETQNFIDKLEAEAADTTLQGAA